ncbi:hypothetical protein B0H14DRAFT_2559169 [Mycena olivaceomarginata]|nr:hypothetical protein B0H14DRAFT_2559169 [Mycena olivaceomarginata]
MKLFNSTLSILLVLMLFAQDISGAAIAARVHRKSITAPVADVCCICLSIGTIDATKALFGEFADLGTGVIEGASWTHGPQSKCASILLQRIRKTTTTLCIVSRGRSTPSPWIHVEGVGAYEDSQQCCIVGTLVGMRQFEHQKEHGLNFKPQGLHLRAHQYCSSQRRKTSLPEEKLQFGVNRVIYIIKASSHIRLRPPSALFVHMQYISSDVIRWSNAIEVNQFQADGSIGKTSPHANTFLMYDLQLHANFTTLKIHSDQLPLHTVYRDRGLILLELHAFCNPFQPINPLSHGSDSRFAVSMRQWVFSLSILDNLKDWGSL